MPINRTGNLLRIVAESIGNIEELVIGIPATVDELDIINTEDKNVPDLSIFSQLKVLKIWHSKMAPTQRKLTYHSKKKD